MSEFYSLKEDSQEAPRRTKSRQTKLFYGFVITVLIGVLIGLAVGIPLSKRDSPDENVQKAQNVLSQYPLIDG